MQPIRTVNSLDPLRAYTVEVFEDSLRHGKSNGSIRLRSVRGGLFLLQKSHRPCMEPVEQIMTPFHNAGCYSRNRCDASP
jgi:hypothetical protein